MKLQLYYTPGACSLAPYVALTEAGAEFDVHVLNFRKGEHMQPAYLQLNPRHRVPTLMIDGEPLTENVAILLWIARTFPAAKLLPTDAWQEIKAISFMAWFASGIHPTLTPNTRPERYCDLPGSEESVKRCARTLMRQNFQIVDNLLEGREWFFDRYTVVDAYFFWCFRRATQFAIDVSAFTRCSAHFARMQQRPSVEKVLAFEAEAVQQLAKAG